MWGFLRYVFVLWKLVVYCLCLGAAPRPRAGQGRGRQMFRGNWFLHHLIFSSVVMVRSATNQRLQAEYFTSNEAPAPAKRVFCPVGSNDSAPKDHASSGRCQTCLAWKLQLSIESATSLGRSSSPWRVFCCQMSSCLELQVFASSPRIQREAESCLLCDFLHVSFLRKDKA